MNIRVSRRQIRDVNCENFERSRGISSFGRTTRPFDHPPPLTCACLCPWVSRFFSSQRAPSSPRSIFVTTCEQTAARTHTRARFPTSEQVFACVCPWQTQVPDNADGTKDSYFPMHAGQNASERTERERSRDKARVGKKRV